MAENGAFLRLTNVSKTFPGVNALSGVSFDVRRGEVHALIGENGAGKSTLIKVLTGVYQSDPGAVIEIEGQRVQKVLQPHRGKSRGDNRTNRGGNFNAVEKLHGVVGQLQYFLCLKVAFFRHFLDFCIVQGDNGNQELNRPYRL
jgi:ATPase subunit of ABC transporter with duplicated ATPase domains